MTDYLALQRNEGVPEDSSVGALLDRYEVDVYLGIGFPTPPLANRPRRYTVQHLEKDPDWMLVFRNMDSAVYLRKNDRNRENIERVEAYYARAGVNFDPEVGIDVARILDEAPDWASQHGLVPGNFGRLLSDWETYGASNSVADLIASAYLALGTDARALEIDEELVRRVPTAWGPRRRRIGALMRLGRVEEALEEAEQLAQLQPADPLSRALIEAARRQADLDPQERLASTSRLPVLTRGAARRLGALQIPPEPLSARAGKPEPAERR
jgi:tetratricopeptide (TPR) repeat protein